MSLQLDVCLTDKKRICAINNTFLLLNNVISILDLLRHENFTKIPVCTELEIKITKT